MPFLGQNAPRQGWVGQERETAAHGHPDRGDRLVRFAAHLGQLLGEVPRRTGRCVKNFFGFFGVAAGNPAGHRAQVQAGERGGVEVAAQVVRGFGGPEGGVFDAFLADGVGECVGAADRDGGVLAAVEGVPAEGGGDGADALGVEHVHRAAVGADAGGQLEHVVFGGGGQDRAGVVQDDPGQPAGLAGAGRAEDHRVLVQRQAERVPVVRAAGQDRVVRRGGEQPLGEGEGRAGAAAVAEHGQPSPPPPQLDDGGVAFAGVQAQAQADAQQADPVAGQPAAVEERPLDRDQDQPGGGDQDGDFFHGRGSVPGVACWCRDWTWARRTRRAVPGWRSTSAAISPAIRAVRLSGSRGRSWRWLARAISRSCLPGLPSARRRRCGGAGASLAGRA